MIRKIKLLEKKLNANSTFDQLGTLNQLARAYTFKDIEKTNTLAEEALHLAIDLNQSDEQATAYYNIGVYHLYNNDFLACAEAYEKAFSLSSPKNHLTLTRLNMSLGYIYSFTHNFEKALEYSNRALSTAENNHLHEEVCSIYNNIARIHHNLEEYDIAVQYFNEALKISKEYNLTSLNTFFHMYAASNKMKHYSTDIEKSLLAIESHIEKKGELWFIGPVKILWAVYYILNDTFDVAEINYNIGYEILEEDHLLSYLLESCLDLTHALEYKNMNEEAEKIYLRTLNYLEENKVILGLPKLYLAMSKFYSKKGQIALYQKYLRSYVKSKEEIENILSHYF